MVSDLGAMARPNHPISDKHDPEEWDRFSGKIMLKNELDQAIGL
ncbi:MULTISPECIES: hypothetical protein [unclassified Bradyrhizobium]